MQVRISPGYHTFDDIDGGIAALDFSSIDPNDGEVRYEEHGPFERAYCYGVMRIPEDALLGLPATMLRRGCFKG